MKHVSCLSLMMRSVFSAAPARKSSFAVFRKVMFSRDMNLRLSSLSSSFLFSDCQLSNISEISCNVLCVSDHFKWRKGRPVLPDFIASIMVRYERTTFACKTSATADEGNYIKVITVGTANSIGTVFSLVNPVAPKKITRKISAFLPNSQKVEDTVWRVLTMPV